MPLRLLLPLLLCPGLLLLSPPLLLRLARCPDPPIPPLRIYLHHIRGGTGRGPPRGGHRRANPPTTITLGPHGTLTPPLCPSQAHLSVSTPLINRSTALPANSAPFPIAAQHPLPATPVPAAAPTAVPGARKHYGGGGALPRRAPAAALAPLAPVNGGSFLVAGSGRCAGRRCGCPVDSTASVVLLGGRVVRPGGKGRRSRGTVGTAGMASGMERWGGGLAAGRGEVLGLRLRWEIPAGGVRSASGRAGSCCCCGCRCCLWPHVL